MTQPAFFLITPVRRHFQQSGKALALGRGARRLDHPRSRRRGDRRGRDAVSLWCQREEREPSAGVGSRYG